MTEKLNPEAKKSMIKGALVLLVGLALISYLIVVYVSGGTAFSGDGGTVDQGIEFDDSNVVDAEEISQIPPTSIRYSEGTGDWTYIEYMNLECKKCAKQHERINEFQDEFEGKIAFAVKHFPINTHPTSKDRAVAAECAGSQGQFIPFIEKAFALEDVKKDPFNDMYAIAEELELDMESFESCVANETTLDIVAADAIEALGTRAKGLPHGVLIDETGQIIAAFEGSLNVSQLREQLNRFWDEQH